MSNNRFLKTTAFLALLFTGAAGSLQAQELEWAKAMGGTGSQFVRNVVLDGSGNVYNVGQFAGTADFDPGTGVFNLTSVGGEDMFVQKLDANGNFLWAKAMGGTTTDYVMSAAVDASGNVFTTGYLQGTVDFDPSAATYNLTSAGGQDIFVSKLDADGNFVWAKQIGSTSWDFGKAIVTDAAGNVYVAGDFNGTVDFDPGTGTNNVTSAGSYDGFILKLTNSGNFGWVRRVGNSYAGSLVYLAIDGSGNLYTTGNYMGVIDFDPGAGTYNLDAGLLYNRAFIQKLDASGNFVWARKLDGSGSTNGQRITIDGSGNVYLAGSFDQTPDFDPGTGTSTLTSAGSNDNFIVKLNSSGNFVWARGFGGSEYDYPSEITLDPSGNVYTVGTFQSTVDFNPGAGVYSMTSSGEEDAFVQQLTPSGNFVWAKKIGTAGGDGAIGIDISSSGVIYIGGYFSNTADFDIGSGTYNLTAVDNPDAFCMKLSCHVSLTETKTACGTYTWRDGNTYTSSQSGVTHTVPGVAAGGCDSLYILNLTINPNNMVMTAASQTNLTCNGDTDGAASVNAATGGTGAYTYNWTPGNPTGDGTTSITGLAAGTWTCTVTDVQGCMASQTFTITQPAVLGSTFTHNACESYLWVDGVTYTSSNNTATHTFTSAQGCDSIVSLNLTISHGNTGTAVITACNSYTWINGVTYTSSNNTATHTLMNVSGCDSVVTLNLTINNATTGTAVLSACNSYTWINGVTYTSSNNTATHTLMNSVGCDSIVTLNLTILHATTGTDVITSCDPITWINGVTYTSSNNTATHTLMNSVGCDSIVTLNLTIQSSSGTDVVTACDSYTWIDGITYTASNTTATHVLTNAAGCDSTVTLNLTINNSPSMTATDNGLGVLTASSASSYQWINCTTNQPISGATSATFTPTANGTYAVIGTTTGSCSDTSNCVVVSNVGTDEWNTLEVSIVPNPSSDVVTILFDNETAAELIIRDAQGKEMRILTIHPGQVISITDFSTGVYFFELVTVSGKTIQRVVKS